MKKFLVVAAAALAVTGCGSSRHEAGGTTTAPATPVSPAPMTLTVFTVRRGILRPTVVHVPRSTAPGAALGALGLAAPVTVSGGTATVRLPKATDVQVASIVYTLTQFPAIRRVDVAGRHGLTRADFAAYLPPISVESPAPGAAVPPTFRVRGTASVFEATFVVQAVRNGKVIQRRTVMATEGAPGRGTFSTTLHVTPGPVVVRAFAPSAADGSPQHEVDVAVVVRS